MPAFREGFIDHRHLQRRIYDRPVFYVQLPERAELPWGQRNRLGFIGGALRGAAAVRGQQPAQSGSQQVPEFGSCGVIAARCAT